MDGRVDGGWIDEGWTRWNRWMGGYTYIWMGDHSNQETPDADRNPLCILAVV